MPLFYRINRERRGYQSRGEESVWIFQDSPDFSTRQVASVAIEINQDQPTANKENAVHTLMMRDSPPT